jgi:hypothetical protein
MSTRYNNGSHYENHQTAAELHDGAAHAHRSAAETHEKQDHQTGQERSRQALEHSQEAYKQTELLHANQTNEHGLATFGHAEIAALAHALWQARGCPQGSPEEDWFQAARELRARAEKSPGENAKSDASIHDGGLPGGSSSLPEEVPVRGGGASPSRSELTAGAGGE